MDATSDPDAEEEHEDEFGEGVEFDEDSEEGLEEDSEEDSDEDAGSPYLWKRNLTLVSSSSRFKRMCLQYKVRRWVLGEGWWEAVWGCTLPAMLPLHLKDRRRGLSKCCHFATTQWASHTITKYVSAEPPLPQVIKTPEWNDGPCGSGGHHKDGQIWATPSQGRKRIDAMHVFQNQAGGFPWCPTQSLAF